VLHTHGKTVPHGARAPRRSSGPAAASVVAPAPTHTGRQIACHRNEHSAAPSITCAAVHPNEAHVSPREQSGEEAGCWQIRSLTTASQPSEKEPQSHLSAAHLFGVHGAGTKPATDSFPS